MLRRFLIPVLGLALLLGAVGLAEANGHPHRVVMAHAPGLSNWGPVGATGIGEFVPVEGEVRFIALGLPNDIDGVYVLWLLNSETGEAMALGEPKVDDQGVTGLNRVLPRAIPDKGWDILIVSVEEAAADRSAPGDRRSIAGRITDGNAVPALQLPNTGGTAGPESAPPVSSPPSVPVAPLPIAPLVGAVVVGGTAGAALTYWLARRRA